jgi:3-hydroxyisobutyrate dehydrogenase
MTTIQPTARQITPVRPGHSDGTATPAIAFLGTGRMGAPMAANLARSGLAVRVWNRSASRAAALTTDGATVASSPADAAQGAGILITMLADGPATEQVWNGPDGLLTTPPGLIWVQMATVGTEWTERFAATATRHGVRFVDAPVSGSQGPAQAGQLTILASPVALALAAIAAFTGGGLAARRAGRPFLPGALRQLLPGAAGTGITYLIGHLAGTTG